MENSEKDENESSIIARGTVPLSSQAQEESFIVENHNRVLSTLGLETGSLMAERVFAANSGEFQAVQIVSGSDSTEAGKGLAMELMQYEHYRRAFIDSALTYYDEMPESSKPDLEPGLAASNEIIKNAELKFGPLPPLAEPTKREIKAYRKLYSSRISLREMPELMLPGNPSVVEGTDKNFGYLGVLSEDGFDSAMD
ncbi:MAG: hypothetical protein OJI67_20770, partial [Prosthecobacter sp.]|nr:hypothetical protein [Prosthecobacter sp.]